MDHHIPYIIEFDQIGSSSIGYISVAENKKLPFETKRVFWTYFTPESVIRGHHAHYKTEQILIAATGRIVVITEDIMANKNTYVLENAHQGLYIPPFVWHTMQYSHYSSQVVLASASYDESDYIRNYDDFRSLQNKWANQ